MQDSIIKLALDIGNKKIKFIVGELSADGKKLKILDYLEYESEGIKKNVIENSEALAGLISQGVNEISKRIGIQFNKVSLGVTSDKLVSKTGYANLEFREMREITEEDLEKLSKMVKSDILTADEVVVEEERYNIRINSLGILKKPVGQIGEDLQGNIHLITLEKKILQPFTEVVNKAGLAVEDIWLKVSASAKATLNHEDMQMGVALVDIGEGITDIAIYKNNKIIYTKSILIGGMHFVSDIAYLLGLSLKEAEYILEKFKNKDVKNGKIMTELADYDVKEIYKIVEARTGDLIEFIYKTIEESGFDGYLGKGIVFTGGGVWLDELLNKASNKLKCAVRKVAPIGMRGLEKPLPSYSTVVGILLNKLKKEYIIRKKENRIEVAIDEQPINNNKKHENKAKVSDTTSSGFVDKIKKWISNFI